MLAFLLVRNFILAFLNPEINVNHAQLVFTTHDTWQLSNQLLRRDEIWFTEKDTEGVSTLYSKADEDIYQKLCRYGDEVNALKPARLKFDQCVRDGRVKPSEMWPCTTVQELVGEIKSKIMYDL